MFDIPYILNMYKDDLALNNLQWLIYHKDKLYIYIYIYARTHSSLRVFVVHDYFSAKIYISNSMESQLKYTS